MVGGIKMCGLGARAQRARGRFWESRAQRVKEKAEKFINVDNHFGEDSRHYSNTGHLEGNFSKYFENKGFDEDSAYVMGRIAGRCVCTPGVGDVYVIKRFLANPVDVAISKGCDLFTECEILELEELAKLVKHVKRVEGIHCEDAYNAACGTARKMYDCLSADCFDGDLLERSFYELLTKSVLENRNSKK